MAGVFDGLVPGASSETNSGFLGLPVSFPSITLPGGITIPPIGGSTTQTTTPTTTSTTGSLTSTTTTATTASSTTTSSVPSTTSTTASSTISQSTIQPSTTIVTSFVGAPTTSSPSTRTSPTGTLSNAAASPAATGFFQNKGLVAGVFTVLGIVVVIALVGTIWVCIRRRRTRDLDREIAEAALVGPQSRHTGMFMRDDNSDHEIKPSAPQRRGTTATGSSTYHSSAYTPSAYSCTQPSARYMAPSAAVGMYPGAYPETYADPYAAVPPPPRDMYRSPAPSDAYPISPTRRTFGSPAPDMGMASDARPTMAGGMAGVGAGLGRSTSSGPPVSRYLQQQQQQQQQQREQAPPVPASLQPGVQPSAAPSAYQVRAPVRSDSAMSVQVRDYEDYGSAQNLKVVNS